MSLVAGADISLTTAAVQAAIADYLVSLTVFAPVVVAEIIAVVMGVSGVTDVVVNAPVSNVAVTQTQRVVPGLITVGVTV